jgi:hypothetical protein
MVSFARPVYTKSRIQAAGKRIVKGNATIEDTLVLENFRAAHAYIINTFQMNARRHASSVTHTVGQRLKRRNTIIDKLRREPSMPLHSMQDIAGCRIICGSQTDLYKVCTSLRNARFHHVRLNDAERYDYILHPKPTGYRGVHDVYEYRVQKEPSSNWNGLRIELQFRTRIQHAWATAVEVADLITSSRIKFNDAQSNYLEYFQLSSEVLARAHENQNSCCSEYSNEELVWRFKNLEDSLGLLKALDTLRGARNRRITFRRNTLLIFRFNVEDEQEKLEVKTFETVSRAIEEYDRLEKTMGDSADVVFVRGESEESIRDAFRNYFSDARDFVDLVNSGIAILQK